MTKIIKIIANVLFSLMEILVLLVIIALFSIRSISVQNYLGKEGSRYASEWLGAEVRLDRIEILFFDRISIKGLYLEDKKGDTLLNLGELYVNYDLVDIVHNLRSNDNLVLHLDEVGLFNTTFNLSKSKDSVLNLQFLIDAFSSDKPKSDPTFTIDVGDFFMENTTFLYANHTEEKKAFGVDFNHLLVNDLSLFAQGVVLTEKSYSATISHLSLIESSGFRLNHFEALASFSESGLYLDKTLINTDDTDLVLQSFALKTQDYSSYAAFVDEVAFSAVLDSSCVSMKDVSLFAPALQGMDQDIYLKANVSQFIANLNIHDLALSFGEHSSVQGDFVLPDFRNLDDAVWTQQIAKMYVTTNDLNQFKLPGKEGGVTYLTLPEQVQNLGYIAGRNIAITGHTNALTMELNNLNTAQGTLNFTTPLLMKNMTSTAPLTLASATQKRQFIQLNQFDLGGMLAESTLGKVNGSIGFHLELDAGKHVKISKINGLFSHFYALDYNYKNVSLSNVDVAVNLKKSTPEITLNGSLYVRDEHIDLVYKGKTIIGEEIELAAVIDLECMNISKFLPDYDKDAELITTFSIKGKGKAIDELVGNTFITDLYFEQDNESFTLDNFDLSIKRMDGEDEMIIKSDILDATVKGYADLDMFVDNIVYQASRVFPVFLPEMVYVEDTISKFQYSFDIHDVNPLLDVLYPAIQIADHTIIDGEYDGKSDFFSLTVRSDSFSYENISVYNIRLMQDLFRGQLTALYRTGGVYLKENKLVNNTHFTTIAGNSFMDSHLIFHDKNDLRSNLEWQTLIFEKDGFDIDILPSFFNINNHKWELNDQAHINFSGDCFFINDFNLFRDDQQISIDGQLSKHPADQLFLDVVNVDLNDFSLLISTEQEYAGTLDLKGYLSEPLTELKFAGDATLKNLVVDNREVGDLSFRADYNILNNGIGMKGDLKVRGHKTFSFKGDYWLNQPDSCLAFKLNFKNTDISLVNAYLDPNVVSGIRGNLSGNFDLSGSLKKPIIGGEINLQGGEFVLALLGAKFKYEGNVVSNEHGILINNMPITDEEGNTGFLHGFLFHTNFSDFIYEIVFNFEDHPTLRNPLNPSEPRKLDKFLVMRTRYTDESIYYGDAYMTGTAVVAGTTDNLDVTVNAKTRRGTWINFPMYGPKTFEEEGFIRFRKPEGEEEEDEQKIDFTGVNLSLNFDITPSAQVKLIFDENIGDEITANGNAKLNINLDNYGDIALNGTYSVSEGVYNFALGPYRQNFFISDGGTVRWTGDPYTAQLDIRAYYRTIANLNVVMPDVVETRTTDNDEIYSYINLRGEMTKPQISFDLDAPKSGEAGRTIINRIRADQDELNRQFFAILIQKRFLPLAGMENTAGARGNAFLDMASTQINSVLDMVSTDYKLNVNLEADNVTGEEVYEFGVAKGFLDDRLIVRGSFGMGRQTTGGNNMNQSIIDVHVEYLLNEKGSFRVSVFNESNTNRIVLNTNRGHFTQGVGINYKEDFYNLQDFKLLQSTLNVFRKDKRVIEKNYIGYEVIPMDLKINEEIKKEDTIKIEEE